MARPTTAMFQSLSWQPRDEELKFVNLVFGKARSHLGDVVNLESIVNLSQPFTCVEGDFRVLGIGISLT